MKKDMSYMEALEILKEDLEYEDHIAPYPITLAAFNKLAEAAKKMTELEAKEACDHAKC